jgi:hypothetical protein
VGHREGDFDTGAHLSFIFFYDTIVLLRLSLFYPKPPNGILAHPIQDIKEWLVIRSGFHHYSATHLQVMRRLRAMLGGLSETVPAPQRNAVMLRLKRADASIARSFVDIEDRRDALRADRQGIGLTLDAENFTDTLGDEPTNKSPISK